MCVGSSIWFSLKQGSFLWVRIKCMCFYGFIRPWNLRLYPVSLPSTVATCNTESFICSSSMEKKFWWMNSWICLIDTSQLPCKKTRAFWTVQYNEWNAFFMMSFPLKKKQSFKITSRIPNWFYFSKQFCIADTSSEIGD